MQHDRCNWCGTCHCGKCKEKEDCIQRPKNIEARRKLVELD